MTNTTTTSPAVSSVGTAAEVWSKCLVMIKDNVSPQVFNTWFTPLEPVKLVDSELTIKVPTSYYYEWLEDHYVTLLRRTIRHYLGNEAKLMYEVVVDNLVQEQQITVNIPTVTAETAKIQQQVSLPLSQNRALPNPNVIPGLKKMSVDPQLNPYATFDSFLEGDCNRLARNACIAIARSPGDTAFNPLFIYSGVGLGKSHLIQAVGNEVRRIYPNKVVYYTQTEKFVNQYVESVRSNSMNEFMNLYNMVDVLILDDVQFLINKDRTQEVLFNIFNHLHQHKKQIILTADVPPKELKGIEERLISRFAWGLTADLRTPDEETRKAILLAKMAHEGIEIPEEVVDYVARKISTNVRDLEGALIGIMAQSSFNRKAITIELAEQVTRNFITNPSRELTIEQIMKIVADYFHLPVEKLKEAIRRREFVQPRQIAMFFCKEFTKASLKTIGQYFGGRDHSTVIHALRTVKNLHTTDRGFRKHVDDLTKLIENQSN